MQKEVKSAQSERAFNHAVRRSGRFGWFCVSACFALVIAAGLGLLRGHAQSSQSQNPTPVPIAANTVPAVTGKPDEPATANASQDPQKQEIASECADLLKMATALKTEVDKTTKDTLSVTVVRKAGQIEQLAHKVRLGPGKS